MQQQQLISPFVTSINQILLGFDNSPTMTHHTTPNQSNKNDDLNKIRVQISRYKSVIMRMIALSEGMTLVYFDPGIELEQ